MNQTVVGIVSTRLQLEDIINGLKIAGFRNSDISILVPDQTGIRDLAYEKHSKAPEGTSTGAAAGAMIGGTLGWLAGVGTLALPGLGAFIAAGPIVAALSGIGVGSALGGVTGGLIGLGIPEYEAKQYESKLQDGNMLLSVHTDNAEWTKKAEHILKDRGARDVTGMAEEPVKQKATTL